MGFGQQLRVQFVVDARERLAREVSGQFGYPVSEGGHDLAHGLGGLSACLHTLVLLSGQPPSLLPGSGPSPVRRLSAATMWLLRLPLTSSGHLVWSLVPGIGQ